MNCTNCQRAVKRDGLGYHEDAARRAEAEYPVSDSDSMSTLLYRRAYTLGVLKGRLDEIESTLRGILHAGTGSGGQTTLTYGWPWPGEQSEVDNG